MNFSKKIIYKLFFISIFLITPLESHAENCRISEGDLAVMIEKINANKNLVRNLSYCQKSNHDLVHEIVKINPGYFIYIDEELKRNQLFVIPLIIEYPEIMQYLPDKLRGDSLFIQSMSNLHPGILEYVTSDILDNKIFIKRMVKRDPHNFKYASDRLQNNFGVALLAVKGNGETLKYASEKMQSNQTLAREAVKSYAPAINFIPKKLRQDEKVKEIVSAADYSFLDNMDSFLRKNYSGLPVGPNGVRGYRIVNFGYFFGEDMLLINRPYATKWKVVYRNGQVVNENKLSPGKNKNIPWQIDLEEYPKLTKEIKGIFSRNGVDKNTIDSLSIVSLWEGSFDDLEVLVFDLYLLRNIRREYSDPVFSNVTSMMGIAREKGNGKWDITVVDALYDVDLKSDIRYKNGHRKYQIWDLYQIDKDDNDLKILFKVDDKDSQYFELFAKQPNKKYARIFKGGGYNMDDF